MFRDQIGMRPQAVAGPFDLYDDSVMQQPIQKCGRDHGIPEDLAPFGKAAILLSALNQCATMTKLGIMDGGVVGRRDAGALGFLTP